MNCFRSTNKHSSEPHKRKGDVSIKGLDKTPNEENDNKNAGLSLSTTASSSPQTPTLIEFSKRADSASPQRECVRELNKEQIAWDRAEAATHIKGKFQRAGFILSYTGSLSTHYDLEGASIGKGTYGSVSKAVNRSTGNVRAVKTISKSKVKNIKRFRQEIAIMKALDHPNIIKLHETFEDHKNIYLVLELCTGGELFDRILEKGYFGEADASVLMKQILQALYYCHLNKIVHRDLKPENFLFLDRSNSSPLKIIDFGLAARCNDSITLSTKAGTPYYVAPQVLQGQYDSKCDIWSAGVIMYILLCGYPPFYGENDAEILRKVKIGKVQFIEDDWKGVSSSAKDLLVKMLCYDPKMRLSAGKALNHPWIVESKPETSLEVPIQNELLKKFRSFRAVSQLKKAALTVIAQQMSETEISDLKQLFISLDENGDGSLTVKELTKGLEQCGKVELKDINCLLHSIDSDGSGLVDYTEFIAASLDKRTYIQESTCWEAFRVFDLDGNGKITQEELLRVMGSQHVQGVFSTKDLRAAQMMIEEVDQDGDGQIDFDEFMEMMRNKS